VWLAMLGACGGGSSGLDSGVVAPTPSVNVQIQLDEGPDGRIVQRDASGYGDLQVAGTYADGSPEAIEARVLGWESGTEVLPWVTIDEDPVAGTFAGALRGIPAGGWYRIEVRAIGSLAATAGEARFGVGVLVACAGQSQIQLWFSEFAPSGPDDFDFEPPVPSDFVRMYRHDGFNDEERKPDDWREVTGVGATVFANRLHDALGVPIGLLPYAAGGSALWQSNSLQPAIVGFGPWGWWLADDSGRHPGFGRYPALVDGITAAGGVEAVL